MRGHFLLFVRCSSVCLVECFVVPLSKLQCRLELEDILGIGRCSFFSPDAVGVGAVEGGRLLLEVGIGCRGPVTVHLRGRLSATDWDV